MRLAHNIHMHGPSYYLQHVLGMLDCAPLIILFDVCLTTQTPVVQWLRRWSRKPEIPGSIPRHSHFSFSLNKLPTAKQLNCKIIETMILEIERFKPMGNFSFTYYVGAKILVTLSMVALCITFCTRSYAVSTKYL